MQQHSTFLREAVCRFFSKREYLVEPAMFLFREQSKQVEVGCSERGVTGGKSWSWSCCIKQCVHDHPTSYCIPQNPSEQSGSALCVADEGFTGFTGCCGSPCKESRTLSSCQVPLVLSFILAEVFLTFGLCLCRALPLFPALPPLPQFQVVFTILNQRLWINISKSWHYSGLFWFVFSKTAFSKNEKISFLVIMCFQGLTCRVRWGEVHPLPWEFSFMMSVCTRAGQHLRKEGLELSRAALGRMYLCSDPNQQHHLHTMVNLREEQHPHCSW